MVTTLFKFEICVQGFSEFQIIELQIKTFTDIFRSNHGFISTEFCWIELGNVPENGIYKG